MHTALIALLVAPLLQAPAEPAGKADKGAAVWKQKFCANCHGDNGEGGYGPDLAGGRGLTFEQFKHPIRTPWGVMPFYTPSQLPDDVIADLYAFIKTKPPVMKPGEWHWRRAPANAPLGQQLYMQTAGCGQCHEPENRAVRRFLGEYASDVNFDYFRQQVYEHTKKWPRGNMPSFSPDRLPPSVLREIYDWTMELGLRPSLGTTLTVGERQGETTTYTLSVMNRGVKDKGMAAEDVTVFLRIPQQTKVVSATGPAYVGVQPFATLGLEPALALAPHAHDSSGHVEAPPADLSGEAAVWKLPQLAAAEKLSFTVVLSGPLTADVLRGFEGSAVFWERPGRRDVGRPPILIYRDLRGPDKGDHERIPPPSMPTALAGN